MHKIYEALDGGNEVRAVFLDISKAFDRVWHRGLLSKLKSLGIQGSLYDWFESYLSDHQQRVVVEGANSDWRRIEAVPQGSVLGPLLFLIYINDLPDAINSDCFLFADDCFLLNEVTSPNVSASVLNNDLKSIASWANRWLVTMNSSKTKVMVFSSKKNKPDHPLLFLNNTAIEEVPLHEHLGLTLSSNLSWRPHNNEDLSESFKKIEHVKTFKIEVK